ncbi:MAG: hypothetical protein EOO08_08645 [Chitinophagaceae bacterium]|nr:MAG: hypothetical protein EOO08_08645 [Chitinophagaceae bacterium]
MRFVSLLLLLGLASCSSGERHVYILTTYGKAVLQDTDSGARVALTEPGLYEGAREVRFSGKRLVLAEPAQQYAYELPEGGEYVINLLEDTLLSVPARYGREQAGGISLPTRPSHSGNATYDSMTAKAARARDRQEQRRSEERLRNGRTNILTLLPGKMERISANGSARVFFLTQPPAEVRGQSADDIDYYEINRYDYFLQRALHELEETDPVRASERQRREFYRKMNEQ